MGTLVTMLHGKPNDRAKKQQSAVRCALTCHKAKTALLPVTCAGGVASDYSVSLPGNQKDLWAAAVAANAESRWEHNYTYEKVSAAAHVPI